MDAYISKPIRTSELFETIERVIGTACNTKVLS
jgi:hypothetical protein